jgi:hypothetical protein
MAKSDLLKEAIADAKAVKETALANAKIALQEAFMPRFENMLKTSMENQMMDEDEEEMPAEEPVDGFDAEEEMPEGGDDFNWTDDQLSASVGGNDYDFTVGMSGDGEEEMPEEMPEEEPVSDEDMSAEYTEGLMNNMEDDIDLKEIIRELEGDLMDEEEMEMPEKDPYAVVPEGYGHDDDDQNIDEIIEAILRENEEEAMALPAPAEPATPEVVAELEGELEAKEEELHEAYRTVKQLKSIINEVNLLNAKLLYTNKLFRNFELSQNQKMKVIENFDGAGNPREVKLVFTTLAESFKRPATKKRVVKESAASRPTRTTAPSRQTTQVLTEGFELANRWKKLAGLL